ncbi:M16 peptidase-like protein [Aureococcus anophagefferens]|nr:M16 peptidase-like protein [Aureococcus anophagefferens]
MATYKPTSLDGRALTAALPRTAAAIDPSAIAAFTVQGTLDRLRDTPEARRAGTGVAVAAAASLGLCCVRADGTALLPRPSPSPLAARAPRAPGGDDAFVGPAAAYLAWAWASPTMTWPHRFALLGCVGLRYALGGSRCGGRFGDLFAAAFRDSLKSATARAAKAPLEDLSEDELLQASLLNYVAELWDAPSAGDFNVITAVLEAVLALGALEHRLVDERFDADDTADWAAGRVEALERAVAPPDGVALGCRALADAPHLLTPARVKTLAVGVGRLASAGAAAYAAGGDGGTASAVSLSLALVNEARLLLSDRHSATRQVARDAAVVAENAARLWRESGAAEYHDGLHRVELPARDATVAPPPGLERLCAPRSSASDDRSYRVVRLANGVTCALVSDPGEKAARRSPSTPPTGAEGALDRFGRFFSEPLLAESCVDREMHAVDAEHSKNLQDDGRRLPGAPLSASPAHSFSNFSTGCLETLRFDGVRDALLEFWRDRYDPAIATACLVGPRSLEDLEELCLATFGAMAKRGAFEAAPEAAPLFPPIARVHERRPVRDLRTRPASLSVDLTPRGEARRYSDVLPRIFEAVGALARDCEDAVTPRRLWRELAVVSGARFDFMYSKAKRHGLAAARAVAPGPRARGRARRRPDGPRGRARRRLEPAARRARRDAPGRAPRPVAHRRPRRHQDAGRGPGFSDLATERWYGVEHARRDVPDRELAALRAPPAPPTRRTSAPAPNPFLPDPARLKNEIFAFADDAGRRAASARPPACFADGGLACWWKTDAIFGQPKAYVTLARHLRNLDKGRADAHAARWKRELLQERTPALATSAAPSTRDAEDVAARRARRRARLVHAHGAVDEADARGFARAVRDRLPISGDAAWPAPPRVRLIPRGSTLVARPSPNAAADENAALQRSYDVGSRDDLAVHAATSLFVHVFKEPFFTQLRTREQLCEQLGYLVSARYASTRGRLHVVLTVQSKTADPPALRDRFDAFVRSFDVASVDLERAKDALATKWTEPDDSMYREASRFWGEVDHPAPEGPLRPRDRARGRAAPRLVRSMKLHG